MVCTIGHNCIIIFIVVLCILFHDRETGLRVYLVNFISYKKNTDITNLENGRYNNLIR